MTHTSEISISSTDISQLRNRPEHVAQAVLANANTKIAFKRPVGAPKQMEGGKSRRLYLDDKTIEAAFLIGFGNISQGIRVAVDAFVKNQEKAINKNHSENQ